MDKKTKWKAFELCESGDGESLYTLIKPYLEKNDPFAHFFYSRFRLPSWNESDEEFERRTLKHLQLASEGGVPEAKYQLGLLHTWGVDFVDKDEMKAAKLFKEASELGHSLSKLYYGQDLIYGTNGIEKDEKRGFKYLLEAKREGVEGVESLIERIKNNLKNGP